MPPTLSPGKAFASSTPRRAGGVLAEGLGPRAALWAGLIGLFAAHLPIPTSRRVLRLTTPAR
ncbi:hypothetical protein GCM10023259_011420 [Thermocatellispora tengchongensis]